MSVVSHSTYNEINELGSDWRLESRDSSRRPSDEDENENENENEEDYTTVDDIMKIPNRLRLAFKILIGVNCVLLVLFFIAKTPGGQFLWKQEEEVPKAEQFGQSDTTYLENEATENFRLCTSCEDIKKKIKSSYRYKIEELRTDKNNCCFQKISQLFWFFEKNVEDALSDANENGKMGHAHNYSRTCIKRATTGPKSLVVTEFNSENALTVKALKKPIAHVFLDSASPCENTHQGLKLLPEEKPSSYPSEVDYGIPEYPSTALKLPKSAFYFVYAHVQFKNSFPPISFKLILNKDKQSVTLLESVILDRKPASVLQGVFFLNENDSLTVMITCNRVNMGSKINNYFGIFLI